ncbi:RHS repeat-associated core domain-containing protein [Pseudomonas sp. PGPR40]|uniref:RHS repeat-associated core domain-containing protein n=1 Tax=Pseudomonas sp. PGPR40 TaxID=2913476 RepID=UPI002ED6D89F
MSTPSRKTILLATDQQQSVLNALDANQPHSIAYTLYGYRPRENGLLSQLGFNGELPDRLTGLYHLGREYRQFNPVLMRFNSPDRWSPFGRGGLNAYAYCDGDPRNKLDPSGHTPVWLKNFLRSRGLMRRPIQRAIAADASTFRLPQTVQRNTQKNIQASIPEDGRPKEIVEIQNRLELDRQNHAFNLEQYPNITNYRNQSHVQIDGSFIPSRKAYSKLAVEHHNKTGPSISAPAARPKKISFEDHATVHEVETLVEKPVGGWKKVADIRK